MMKHLFSILALLLPMLCSAQVTAVLPAVSSQPLTHWDTEINLDTIDQEKLPQIVTGGVLLTTNISNYIIHQDGRYFSSYMRLGLDVGGLVDFRVTKHFAIQGRLVFTAEQNRFGEGFEYDRLWAFGIDVPVLFLARFGNMEQGYLSFGGGPYTHFNYASNIGRKGAEIYKLHDNNFGLAATVTYEFPIGIQIMANYLVSLSDIIEWRKQNAATSSHMYPQRVELGVAYRWRTKSQNKNQ